MVKLLGLYSDRMGSGKTAAAQTLARLYGFVQMSFAAPIKAMSRELLMSAFGCTREVADQIMTSRGSKEEAFEELHGRSPRYVMQTLGTEWGRELIAPDLWVGICLRQAAKRMESGMSVVIDDVRYRNEADAIRAAGGEVIRVYRPRYEDAGGRPAHKSEGAIPEDYPFLDVLVNAGTLSDFHHEVEQFAVETLGLPPRTVPVAF